MTNVGRNMQCAYTSDVEGSVTFKIVKVLKSELHVRRILTDEEYLSDMQQDATIKYNILKSYIFCSTASMV
jgi:hypothetical protein